MTRATLILGGPGTGKTTRLLDIVEDAIGSGTPPDQIAFLTFTKAAAGEAIARACDRFALEPRALPWFRTVHSLCFKALGLTRSEVLGPAHFKELAEITGEALSDRADHTAPALSSTGDQLLFLEQLARASDCPLAQAWHDHGGMVDWHRLLRFAHSYAAYKADHAIFDFADMLGRYNDGEGGPLPVRLAIVDEAQDLTKAQWRVVRRALSTADILYIAGDDDQAVHRWAGAAVEEFLALPYPREELPVSHRVPREVHALGQEIAGRIENRFEKRWAPTDRSGQVDFIKELDEIDLAASGRWLLLARARSQLLELVEWARGSGVPYSVRGQSAVRREHIEAVLAYERLRGGEHISSDAMRRVLEAMRLPVVALDEEREYAARDLDLDVGPPWHDGLVGISLDDREYYLACRRRGEKLLETPRVRLDTLHGSKGLEAENVLVLTDLTRRTARGLELDPDSEHRVFYVGVTRAMENLYVRVPHGPLGYPM